MGIHDVAQVWQIVRIVAGVTLIIIALLAVVRLADEDIAFRVMAILWGVIQIGTGTLNLKLNGSRVV